MTSRIRIEAMQRTIERIRRERRAGVGIIAPDSDGGIVLTCTAYDRFVHVHTATEAAPLVIIDI